MLSAVLFIVWFQKASILPHRRSLQIPRGRGILKAKLLEEGMKLNWNFLFGRGCQTKNLPWGEYGYFLELHISLCQILGSLSNDYGGLYYGSLHQAAYSGE